MAYTQQEQNLVDELEFWWRYNGWNPATLQKKNLNQLLALRIKMNNDKAYWDLKNKNKNVKQPEQNVIQPVQQPEYEQQSLFAKRLVKKKDR